MRLTLTAFGLELDVSFGITQPEADDEPEPQDSGYTTTTTVGFLAAYDLPEEVPVPMRCNGWPDEDKR